MLNMKRTLSLPCMLMVWVALAWIGTLDLLATFGHGKPAARASDYAFMAAVFGCLLFFTWHLAGRLRGKKASAGLSHSALVLAGAGICALFAALPPYDWGTLGLGLVAATNFLQWLGERREARLTLPPQSDTPDGL
jgi:hypothetical protein